MRLSLMLIAGILGIAASAEAQTQTFTVTAPTLSAYIVNGVADPVLTLERGGSYRFQVSVSGHPFWIKTQQVTGTGFPYSNGVTNNGAQSGDILFTVPMDAPATLYYICQIHSSMGNRIDIVNPAGVDPGTSIASFRIAPNPALASVRFLLPSGARRPIEVFDLGGRLVHRIDMSASEITWDGRDAAGVSLASGMYLVRVRDERDRIETRRLLWLGR